MRLSPCIQSLEGTCIVTARSALTTSVQTHRCDNGCFQLILGRCVQRACSFGYLNRSSSALAYQLPGVVGCAFSLDEVLTVDLRQACVSPDGQHSDSSLYQPPGRCSLPLDHSSPAISFFGASRDSGICKPLTLP